jgi:hypothetical protein
MLVAIMQPYFLPYLGYFQLMSLCDTFVFFDDVQYVTRRWMNRNQILLHGRAAWLTYPVAYGPASSAINQRVYVGTHDAKANVLNKVREAYRRAPHFDEIYPEVESCLDFEGKSVAEVNANLLKVIARRLGLRCSFKFASEFGVQPHLHGEDRIVALCRCLGATDYVNPIGGVELYDDAKFAQNSLGLTFLRSDDFTYPQFGDAFVPSLSVIDALMFNNGLQLVDLLSRCRRLSQREAGSGA